MIKIRYFLGVAFVALLQVSLFAQSTNHFTIISLPDTQHYVDTPANYWHFEAQTQWIVDNRNALNIVFTTHEGDMVEHESNVTEWETSRRIMSTLDKAVPAVPYSIAWGNHDSIGTSTALFETYFGLRSGQNFGVTNFVDYPWWGGNFALLSPATRNENNYQLFSAGGDDYLIIHLAYMDDPLMAYETTLADEVGDAGTVVNVKKRLRWVDSILKQYPNRKAILTTHAFLTPAGIRLPNANFIWDQVIVPNPNVFLIMNGHELGTQAEARRSEFVNGRWCHQLCANYQGRSNGGDGWLRILDFSPSENKIRVKTYSPSLNRYETDANSQFELVLGNDPGGDGGDSIPPTVSIITPLDGTTLAGTAAIVEATAADDVRVEGVQFKLDGAYLGVEDVVEPYLVTVDTTKFSNGVHTLTARARDGVGNITITSMTVTINNTTGDTTLPTVAITSPASGSIVNGSTVISASASDNVGVVGVQFKVDGTNLGAEDMSAPYSVITDVSSLSNGNHTFTAVARDAAGNARGSVGVVLTIGNIPLAPSELFASLSATTQINLFWKDNSANETGFKIERKTGIGGTYVQITNVGANVTSYIDSGLTVGATYYYRVRSTNSSGDSGYSNEARPASSTVVFGSFGALAGGLSHSVALKDDGTVWSWGDNAVGQLGDGTTNSSLAPKKVSSLSGIIQISSGERHVLSLKSNGRVWAWGYSASGQVGDGSTATRLTPVVVSSLVGIKRLEAGADHSLALKSDGTLWTWGKNTNGQIGNATNATQKLPVQISLSASVTDMAAGTLFSSVLLQDGTVWTWGQNTYGQLGNGGTTDSWSPAIVPGLSNVVKIAAGKRYMLALKSDGTVWAWGENSQGQLGAGSPATVGSILKAPIQVSGLTSVLEIAAFGDHSLALKSDGSVWAWGYNNSGQVGNNSVVKAYVPAAVTIPVGTFIGIQGGNSHSLALRSDGTVWSWGLNASGQLGDGTLTNSLVPIQIPGLDLVAPYGTVTDLTPPQLVVNFPIDGQYVTSSTVNLNGTVTDASGVAEVQVNAVIASLSLPNWSATVSNLVVGTNVLHVVAKDLVVPANTVTRDIKVIYAVGTFDGNQNGMPDEWEINYFGMVGDPRAGSTLDPDGDGWDNAAECQAGTSPLDRESRFEVFQAGWNQNQFVISWKSVIGKSYEIESSTTLTNWSPAGFVQATGNVCTWMCTPIGEKQFFRVKPL